ncbi:hypothetical protein WN48_04493 [Eufriesea mexicana]|nr:hypothetical protein WN48_04493 [Eufriesea mexicana]
MELVKDEELALPRENVGKNFDTCTSSSDEKEEEEFKISGYNLVGGDTSDGFGVHLCHLELAWFRVGNTSLQLLHVPLVITDGLAEAQGQQSQMGMLDTKLGRLDWSLAEEAANTRRQGDGERTRPIKQRGMRFWGTIRPDGIEVDTEDSHINGAVCAPPTMSEQQREMELCRRDKELAEQESEAARLEINVIRRILNLEALIGTSVADADDGRQ